MRGGSQVSSTKRLPLSRRLSFRQAWCAVAVALALGSLLAVFQVALDVSQQNERVATLGKTQGELIQGPASRAAYRLDRLVGSELVQGLIGAPGLYRAEIKDDFGDTLAVAEEPLERSAAFSWAGLLLGDEPIITRLPLVNARDDPSALPTEVPIDQTVGDLIVYVDPTQAAVGFGGRVNAIIVSGVLKTLALTLILVALFHHMVTRRLNALSQRVTSDELSVRQSAHGDEIDQLDATLDAWSKHMRRMAEEALQREQRLKAATDAGAIGVWEWDVASDRLDWDAKLHEIYGTNPATFGGDRSALEERIYPGDLKRFRERLSDTLERAVKFNEVFRIVRPDGEVRYVRSSATADLDGEGPAVRVLGADVDVTELKDLEQQLIQSQRLDAIGKLTGGIAHDFNNLLSVVLGNLEFLRQRELSEEERAMLDEASAAAERGADLTRKLLSFGRKAHLAPETLNLNDVIGSMTRLLQTTASERISLDFDLSEEPVVCFLDRSILESALVNLVINARDAMPKGGSITISTRKHSGPVLDHAIDYPPDFTQDSLGPFAQLSVSDGGDGIAPQLRERIFEPFFSTKPVGQGSGMGLSMVHGFCRQSGGLVSLDSAQGEGTTFTLQFPLAAGAAGPADEGQGGRPLPDAESPPGFSKDLRVLLVEDDPAVRRVTSKRLAALGFILTQAESGEAALELVRGGLEVDLLITDVVLPGSLQGPALVAACRRDIPGLRAVVVSGYPIDVIEKSGDLPEGAVFMMKPFKRSDLEVKIAEAMRAERWLAKGWVERE